MNDQDCQTDSVVFDLAINGHLRRISTLPRALVIDDHAGFRVVVKEELKAAFEVTTVASRSDANMEMINKHFDVAIVDMHLQDDPAGFFGGLEVLDTLSRHARDTVTIICSGFVDDLPGELLDRLQPDDIIDKSEYRHGCILRAAKEALERKAARWRGRADIYAYVLAEIKSLRTGSPMLSGHKYELEVSLVPRVPTDATLLPPQPPRKWAEGDFEITVHFPEAEVIPDWWQVLPGDENGSASVTFTIIPRTEEPRAVCRLSIALYHRNHRVQQILKEFVVLTPDKEVD